MGRLHGVPLVVLGFALVFGLIFAIAIFSGSWHQLRTYVVHSPDAPDEIRPSLPNIVLTSAVCLVAGFVGLAIGLLLSYIGERMFRAWLPGFAFSQVPPGADTSLLFLLHTFSIVPAAAAVLGGLVLATAGSTFAFLSLLPFAWLIP